VGRADVGSLNVLISSAAAVQSAVTYYPPMAESRADLIAKLAAHASKLAGAEEGVSCKGTAAESRTYQLKKRAFVFLRPVAMMVKLGESIPASVELAKEDPKTYQAGASGWTTIKFQTDAKLSAKLLSSWIDESHALFTEAVNQPTPAKKKSAKKQ